METSKLPEAIRPLRTLYTAMQSHAGLTSYQTRPRFGLEDTFKGGEIGYGWAERNSQRRTFEVRERFVQHLVSRMPLRARPGGKSLRPRHSLRYSEGGYCANFPLCVSRLYKG